MCLTPHMSLLRTEEQRTHSRATAESVAIRCNVKQDECRCALLPRCYGVSGVAQFTSIALLQYSAA